jgi:hypothetical protein
MKTKQIAPWNLKPGMRVVIHLYSFAQSFHVQHVAKFRSRFTGQSCWRVRFTDELSSLGYGVTHYHAKIGNLPLEKVTIAID